MKYSFYNDYSEGAHPKILQALSQTNLDQEMGYGEDRFSIEAANRIKELIKQPQATVHFVTGGTQANFITITAGCRPYQSVIAADSAHINIHEAGAVEAVGHKINTVPNVNGKIKPDQIQAIVDLHTDEHMVVPKLVLISQSTEIGTVYTKAELRELSAICRKNQLYLYVDGARLGSALMSAESQMTLADLAELVDAFSIGGTKNGALLGEAIVLINPELHDHFRFIIKQHGALLAKGRVLGIQFLELFKDNLYFELATEANRMASQLSQGIKELGYSFMTESSTNQIFPIFPDSLIKDLEKGYGFYVWSKTDKHNSGVRLVTSWATQERAVQQFLSDLKGLQAGPSV